MNFRQEPDSSWDETTEARSSSSHFFPNIEAHNSRQWSWKEMCGPERCLQYPPIYFLNSGKERNTQSCYKSYVLHRSCVIHALYYVYCTCIRYTVFYPWSRDVHILLCNLFWKQIIVFSYSMTRKCKYGGFLCRHAYRLDTLFVSVHDPRYLQS